MAEPNTGKARAGRKIQAINTALRGPVLDVFKTCVPEFQKIERDELYERVMNTPALGELCFKIFRANPAAFGTVMKAANGSPVTGDDQMLSCGRTLAQVVALVVRAMARRYFHLTLNGDSEQKTGPATRAAEIADRLARTVGVHLGSLGRRTRPKRKGTISVGDQIYRALREFLLYEWQVNLIPEYAAIPAALASHVAPHIVGARDPFAVRNLIVAAQAPPIVSADVKPATDSSSRAIARPKAPKEWRDFQP